MLSLGLLTACQESPEDKIRVAPGQAEFARAEISIIMTTIMASMTMLLLLLFYCSGPKRVLCYRSICSRGSSWYVVA